MCHGTESDANDYYWIMNWDEKKEKSKKKNLIGLSFNDMWYEFYFIGSPYKFEFKRKSLGGK